MGRAKTPSFVAARRIITDDREYKNLDKIMNITERMYNAGVRHCQRQLNELRADRWYQKCLQAFFNCGNEDKQKIWSKEIFLCAEAYGLTEFALHEYFGRGKVSGYEGAVGINIVQKNASSLYSAVRKAIFGKRLHFRKFEETCSFEDKRANTGIIYNPENDTVKIVGHVYKLKGIRQADTWLLAAMKHKIKYCRVTREPFGTKYRYFLQIVMEGTSPLKHPIGAGTLAIDPGVSTMAAYTGKELDFKELAPEINKYQKKTVMEQNRFSKLMRANNAECYDSDGKHIRGKRIKYSSSMRKSKMRLRSLYRKQHVYVLQSNNRLKNKWLEAAGSIVKIENMSYKGLQRKSSKTERQGKESIVINKTGQKRSVHKYKRRKRFGGSILKHSPSRFLASIRQKVTSNCGIVVDVSASKLKASQYHHDTGEHKKTKLNNREKIVDGVMVQRDCYSSFVIYHSSDESEPDQKECKEDFDNFLHCQEKLLGKLVNEDFKNPNFGTYLLNRYKKQQALQQPAM